MLLYRLGALGVLLSLGALWEEPLAGSLRQNPLNGVAILILFGFTGLCGFFLLCVRSQWLLKNNRTLMFFSHGAALISVLWLILWCFVWLAKMMTMGDRAEMYVKHSSDLHLFGVGFAMAGYVTGWMAPDSGRRSTRFLMTIGWVVSYMAWFNLFLQPTLKWLWAPAVGGLLVALGAFLAFRRLKRVVETQAPPA